MFIIATKLKKWFVLAAGFAVIAAIGIGWGMLRTGEYQSKVDRSNAMQVTKPVHPEPFIPAASPDFFTEYRLERDKVRSERSEMLRDIVKNAPTDETRQRAQDAVLKLMTEKQRELEIENLIKARGFSDALILLRENSVSAIVKSNSLSREEVLQVADIISRSVGVKPEDITISAKP